MSMEQFITIVVAIVGSGVLSTIIGLIANRWRHDRQADLFEAWINESKLLDELEKRAGIESYEKLTHPRNLALATAGRTYINQATASRLIPKHNLLVSVLVIVGFVTVLAGLLGIMIGAASAVIVEDIESTSMAWVFAFTCLPLTGIGALMATAGLRMETYLSIMRGQVQRTLAHYGTELEPTHDKSLAFRYKWMPGHMPRFNKWHRFILFADLRQSFQYFMYNAPATDKSSESIDTDPNQAS